MTVVLTRVARSNSKVITLLSYTLHCCFFFALNLKGEWKIAAILELHVTTLTLLISIKNGENMK